MTFAVSEDGAVGRALGLEAPQRPEVVGRMQL